MQRGKGIMLSNQSHRKLYKNRAKEYTVGILVVVSLIVFGGIDIPC